MTDLWDKKPKSVKVYESYADDYYHVEEMDAWLKKVKIEHDKAVVAVDYLTQVSLESGAKLEAIKKWYQNQLGLTETADHEIIELGKILENQASSQEAT